MLIPTRMAVVDSFVFVYIGALIFIARNISISVDAAACSRGDQHVLAEAEVHQAPLTPIEQREKRQELPTVISYINEPAEKTEEKRLVVRRPRAFRSPPSRVQQRLRRERPSRPPKEAKSARSRKLKKPYPGLWFLEYPEPKKATKGLWFVVPERVGPTEWTPLGHQGIVFPGAGVAQKVMEAIVGLFSSSKPTPVKGEIGKPAAKAVVTTTTAKPAKARMDSQRSKAAAAAPAQRNTLCTMLESVRSLVMDTGPSSACHGGGELLDMVTKTALLSYTPKNSSTDTGLLKMIAAALPLVRKQMCSNSYFIDKALKWVIDKIDSMSGASIVPEPSTTPPKAVAPAPSTPPPKAVAPAPSTPPPKAVTPAPLKLRIIIPRPQPPAPIAVSQDLPWASLKLPPQPPTLEYPPPKLPPPIPGFPIVLPPLPPPIRPPITPCP